MILGSQKTEAKILSKELIKKAVIEYGTREEFCIIPNPLLANEFLSQPLELSDGYDTPNTGSEITEKDCKPNSNTEIIFGYVRLDFLDSFNAPPAYEKIFLFDDKILRPDSIGYEYYKNFDPNSQSNKDIFLGKAVGQKSIRATILHWTDPSFPYGQKTLHDNGFVITFDKNGEREKLFFIYDGNVYLSTKILKEIREDIVLVDYTQNETSPTPDPAVTGTGTTTGSTFGGQPDSNPGSGNEWVQIPGSNNQWKAQPIGTGTQPPPLTADWKTFVNKKYNYSIKYPTSRFNNCWTDKFVLHTGNEKTSECFAGEDRPIFSIVNSLDGTGKFKTPEYPQCYIVQVENITLNNVAGKKYSNKSISDKESCNKNTEAYYSLNTVNIVLYKNGSPYNITYRGDFEPELLNTILSTFQFTN